MRAVPFSRCAEEEQNISSNICSCLSPPLPLDCIPSFWEKEISSFWLYKSKNCGMVWVGRALKDHLLPIPPGASASFKHKGKESQICLFCCCFSPQNGYLWCQSSLEPRVGCHWQLQTGKSCTWRTCLALLLWPSWPKFKQEQPSQCK